MDITENEVSHKTVMSPSEPFRFTTAVEILGGQQRLITLFTLAIHWLHSLLVTMNYVYFVRLDRQKLGSASVDAYLAFTVITNIVFYAVVSVFYMWAWKYPEIPELAKQRRIYGIVINLFLCDIPFFFIEVDIMWNVRWKVFLQGFCFVWTCISFAYSSTRFWLWFMVKVIKRGKGGNGGRKKGKRTVAAPGRFSTTPKPTFAPQSNMGTMSPAFPPGLQGSPVPSPVAAVTPPYYGGPPAGHISPVPYIASTPPPYV